MAIDQAQAIQIAAGLAIMQLPLAVHAFLSSRARMFKNGGIWFWEIRVFGVWHIGGSIYVTTRY